jgi:hypothetical protein
MRRLGLRPEQSLLDTNPESKKVGNVVLPENKKKPANAAVILSIKDWSA